MKIPELIFRFAACTMLALSSTWSLAQTCVIGIQASNPTSVYLVDSANGTVTDTRTGLMWDRCALGQSSLGCATGTATQLTWQAALNAAATIGTYKGFTDWRMPNIKELRSLAEECLIDPSINGFAFPYTPAGFFWSGSPVAGGTTSAWYVDFYYGSAVIGSRSSVGLGRLVRAGQ